MKPAALQWYVRHVVAYVKAADGQRLATHSAAIVEFWPGDLSVFLRAKRPQRLPVVQATDEVRRLLAALQGMRAIFVQRTIEVPPPPDSADHPSVRMKPASAPDRQQALFSP